MGNLFHRLKFHGDYLNSIRDLKVLSVEQMLKGKTHVDAPIREWVDKPKPTKPVWSSLLPGWLALSVDRSFSPEDGPAERV